MITKELKNKIFNKFSIMDERDHTLLSAFVVCKERKTLYFHIAKTGGSSIDHLLRINRLNDGFLDDRDVSFEDKKSYFQEVVDEWDQYYKFTFIRNKYHQLVSNYEYDKPYTLKNCTFEEFIRNHVAAKSSKDSELYPNYNYWIDQHFITTCDDTPIFDFVGNHKTHKQDVQEVCKNIGIEYQEVKKNLGTYNRKREYSDYYNQELKNIVDSMFPEEIEHFKWQL
jgi:hypothetical protein